MTVAQFAFAIWGGGILIVALGIVLAAKTDRMLFVFLVCAPGILVTMVGCQGIRECGDENARCTMADH